MKTYNLYWMDGAVERLSDFAPIYNVMIAEKGWIQVDRFKPFIWIAFDFSGKTTHFELASLS